MKLHPAAALKIKRLKAIDAFTTDKTTPTVEVRIEQRRPAHLVRFLHHEQIDVAARQPEL